jgi:serine/threonine-protein kinase HipA
MIELLVKLYGREVGILTGEDWRSFTFVTLPSAFDFFSVGSTVLSEAVPLNVMPNRAKASVYRNFFSELLPEGAMLRRLAQLVGVSENDTLGFLAHYGRDIAGALEIYDPTIPGEPRKPYTTSVNAS